MAFTQPTTQNRGTLERIASGLQGLGAGIQGRGAEFLAGQRQQEQQLSEERKRAAAEDIRKAKLLFDQGNVSGVRQLAQQRIGMIQELGGDPSDTAEVFELASLAEQGSEDAALVLRGVLNEAFDAGVMSGLIPPPQPMTQTLTPEEAQATGFGEGDIVQRKPDGTLDVVREGKDNAEKAAEIARKIDQEKFSNVSNLRKEGAALTKDFRDQKAAIQRIRDVSFDKEGNLKQSPAAALALVFNFMKVLDPGSVVRESEFRTAEQARGWLSRAEDGGFAIPSFVRGAIQKINSDGSLLPEQIRDFNNQAEALFQGAAQNVRDDISPIVSTATQRNFDLSRIFPKSILEDIQEPPQAQGNDVDGALQRLREKGLLSG